MPALAPSRQRSPIETTSLPPPDSVPMIEAPPPMSEPSPTTTPAEIRPSTIDVPSVPALKLTKPSCITVVPSARCAPRRTRSRVGDAHAGRDHVVGHPGELVHPVHGDRAAGAAAAAGARSNSLRRARSGRGPGDVGAAGRRHRPSIGVVRPDQPVRRAGAAAATTSAVSAGGAARSSISTEIDPAGRSAGAARSARSARRRPAAAAAAEVGAGTRLEDRPDRCGGQPSPHALPVVGQRTAQAECPGRRHYGAR